MKRRAIATASIAAIFILFTTLSVTAQGTTWIEIARSGDLEAMKEWVEAGGDVNARDENGATVLMWAAMSGNVSTVKYLVEEGADAKQKGI